jgi:hypothetical protein
MPPDYGQEATQLFSQRNNPYCDLLSQAKIVFFMRNASVEGK